MSLYRVRNGFRFGARNQHGPGYLIELTAAEAAGFADKLELVPEEPTPSATDSPELPVADKPKRRAHSTASTDEPAA